MKLDELTQEKRTYLIKFHIYVYCEERKVIKYFNWITNYIQNKISQKILKRLVGGYTDKLLEMIK